MGSSKSKAVVLQDPWRKIDWDNNQAVLRFLNQYKPQNEDQMLRILLVGPAGAGKSSFINSIKTVLLDRICTNALVDNTAHNSFTTEYTTHKIQTRDGKWYPFVFTDLMGLSKYKGVLEEDIVLAMKGHVKEGYKFNPASPLSEDSQFYNARPKPNDKVQVLVCVIPTDKLSIMDDEVLQKIRRIRLEASKLNIAQVIVLTRIDQLCPEIQADERNVYRIPDIKEKMQKASASVGIPLNCMFPVRNYHEEIDLIPRVDSLILSALKHIVQYGDDSMRLTASRFPAE